MDLEQVRCLVLHGMAVGGHAYDHPWLDTLSAPEQADEVRRTVAFLRLFGPVRPGEWVMSYPYGSHTPTTVDLLRQAGCAMPHLRRDRHGASTVDLLRQAGCAMAVTTPVGLA